MARESGRAWNASEAEAFHVLATEYCRLIERHRDHPIRGFLRAVHELLPKLHAAGIRLPLRPCDRKVEVTERTTSEHLRLFRSLQRKLGNRDFYLQVFDAYDRTDCEQCPGSLADDLADIHRDLHRGLLYWKAGDRRSAVWEWRHGSDIHWGEHATGAMRALYWLHGEDDLRLPAPMPQGVLQPSRPRARSRVRPPARRRAIRR